MSLDLILITALMFKHFMADFVLQTPYQVHNKGRFLHPAGFLHVGIHVMLTALVLLLFVGFNQTLHAETLAWVLFWEAVIHYYMDYTKCFVNSCTRWTCGDSYYWWLTGFDQLVHGLTYVGIAAYVLGAS